MRNKLVYLFEDDSFLGRSIEATVSDAGGKCEVFRDAKEAEFPFRKRTEAPSLIIADLAVPIRNSTFFSDADTSGGHQTGLEILRKAKVKWPRAKLVLITGKPSGDVARWCEENRVIYAIKPIESRHIKLWMNKRELSAFIVHGRNLGHVNKLKKALNALKIKPVVLLENPNKGRTVIEKFEAVSKQCDYAIIAMSPDDIGGLKESGSGISRMRQNVVFELGYFCASLGRLSGKIVLVSFGKLEIPSDLSGVIYIDGLDSFGKLTSQLKSELL
jgi:hypothetical protein